MKLGKETKKTYCMFNAELENEEYAMLKEYGLREIAKDDNELVNYAINKILVNSLPKKELKNKKGSK